MKSSEISNICVVGAGNMGHQIALQAALCGFNVNCTDINKETLAKAERFTDDYLAGRVEKGRLNQKQVQEVRARIQFLSDLPTAVAEVDFVIEAVLEVVDIKRRLFADLDRLAPAHAILASNSSAIVSSKLADATQRPDKVLNMHFFNPALVMKLVEVVQGPHTSDETAKITLRLSEKMKKVPIHLKKEVEGFVLNRILGASGREAAWLQEMGVASFEDIDKACVHGAGHSMGPFRMADLVGLDLIYTMGMEAFRKSGDAADLPGPSLVERYMKGEYGEKAGKGWYSYENQV